VKLLSVIHHPVFGGPHNQALRLAGPLARRGWETLVVLPMESGNADARFHAAGLPTVRMPLRRLRATRKPSTHLQYLREMGAEVAALRRLIQSSGVDLVQVNGLVNPHGAVAGRLERRPVVWQLQDTRAPMVVRRAMLPLVDRLATMVMVTGREVARAHPGALGLGGRLVPYLPPVDTSVFRPRAGARSQARRRLGLPQDAMVIGTVGNLNPQKGHEHLLRAVAHLQAPRPGMHVCILGAITPTHMTYELRLRRDAAWLARTTGVQTMIHDPGDDVAGLLPALDVFAMASVPRSEGVPTALLEAMACGLPVVATDVGAVAEVVADEVTGLVVPASDEAALAAALGRLAAASELRGHLGTAARRWVEISCDLEACADLHAAVYDRAVASGSFRPTDRDTGRQPQNIWPRRRRPAG
jgi:glycosyltransferase involved in cell wall biosynthesis